MRKKSAMIVIAILLAAFIIPTSCQPKQEKQKAENECTCPQNDLFAEGEKPDTIFQVGDKQFALRGHIENDVYSEFIVFDCETKTVLATKGATKEWTVYTEDDKLVLGEFFEFGDDKIIWATETIKFDNKELSIIREFNKEAIAQFADEYENSTPNITDSDAILIQLFWAAIRGEDSAKEKFKNANKDLGLDGSSSELFDDLSKKLEEFFD